MSNVVENLETPKNLETPEKLEEKDHVLYCKEDFACIKYLPPPCHCVQCYVYMGDMNPRHYCGKTKCYEDMVWLEDYMQEIRKTNLQSSPYYEKKKYKQIIDIYIQKH